MKSHRKERTRGVNRFHIYARRRFPNLRADPDNITMVDIQKHADYHQIFGLRNPEEIMDYLNSYFWGNKFDITIARRTK